MRKKIRSYLINEYKLELVPSSLPLNGFEGLKRNLYFILYDFIRSISIDFENKKRWGIKFYRFMNKFFPVKYVKHDDRQDEFYYKRMDGKVKLEFQLLNLSSFAIRNLHTNRMVKISENSYDNYKIIIDKFMEKEILMRDITRNKKIEKIFE